MKQLIQEEILALLEDAINFEIATGSDNATVAAREAILSFAEHESLIQELRK